jgi:hypothetical protein
MQIDSIYIEQTHVKFRNIVKFNTINEAAIKPIKKWILSKNNIFPLNSIVFSK